MKLYAHETLLGELKLEPGDASMGGYFGILEPSETYHKDYRKVVWKLWETKSPNWQQLNLHIQCDNGLYIWASAITIDHIRELPEEPIHVSIAGTTPMIGESLKAQTSDQPYVLPWEILEMSSKLTLESELRIELGLEGGRFLDRLKPKYKHPLQGYQFFAQGRDGRNDDVLFQVISPQGDIKLAVIHLTWRQRREQLDYPMFRLYDSFEEFKNRRMIPDRIDWER